MAPNPSFLTMSRQELEPNISKDHVPSNLAAVLSICTPTDEVPLAEQLNSEEKSFLVEIANYINTAYESPLATTDPSAVVSDILLTARHRLTSLSKQTTFSPDFVVVVALLHLISHLFGQDNMKYTNLEQFLETYPVFNERSVTEQEKLRHTANWMHILFQIIAAKKNKGMAIRIIPKFVEGNSASYITGSGQKQATQDRVTVYETEGNVTAIKRHQRKTRHEPENVPSNSGFYSRKRSGSTGNVKRKSTYPKPRTLSEGSYTKPMVIKVKSKASNKNQQDPMFEQEAKLQQKLDQQKGMNKEFEHANKEPASFTADPSAGSGYQNYLPLPLGFSTLPPPALRSQSSFSQAAAAIANFNQSFVQNQSPSPPSSPYVCSPRECYLDIEENGTMKKSTSTCWGLSTVYCASSASALPAEKGASNGDQLQMLRDISADYDFSTESDKNNTVTSFLQQYPSPAFRKHFGNNGSISGQSSPNMQTRTLDRCPSNSMDEGEVDLGLIDPISRQLSWSERPPSASSSLSGRGSALELMA